MSGRRQAYIYGNTVRKPEPARRYREPQREEKPKKKVSTQVHQNRKKALHMNVGYVVFLTIAAVLALVVCLQYLKLQSEISERSKNITALQQELVSVKEKNTTRYNNLMDSINLDEIRKKAMGEMGMKYASGKQVIEYQSPSEYYVKQYADIPKNGVLAQSSKTTD